MYQSGLRLAREWSRRRVEVMVILWRGRNGGSADMIVQY